jgi:hypothetical protein
LATRGSTSRQHSRTPSRRPVTISHSDFAIQFVDFGRPLSVDWERLPRFKDARDGVIPNFGLAEEADEVVP